jgi:septum formation protein
MKHQSDFPPRNASGERRTGAFGEGREAALVLASSSPRRRELLEQLGLPYEVIEPAPDDDPADHRPAVQFALDLAERKGRSVADGHELERRWVLGADTVVFDDEEILLKPADREEARPMLRRLSGRTHRVVTALAVFPPVTADAAARPGGAPSLGGASSTRTAEVARDVTAVTFAPLTDAEIDWYLDTEEWRGVAGGYRIQGRGAALVERVEGTYSTVVGLPIRLLYSMLRHTGYRFP